MAKVHVPGFTASASLCPTTARRPAAPIAAAPGEAIAPQMEIPDPSDTRDQPPVRYHPPPRDDRPPWWLGDNRPPWVPGGGGGSAGGGDVAGDWPAYRRCLAGCDLTNGARILGCEEFHGDSAWDKFWCDQESWSRYRDCMKECLKDYEGRWWPPW